MTDEPDFLRRWSRRKQAARKGSGHEALPDADAQAPQAPHAEPQPSSAGDPPAGQPESATGDAEALDLPDIDGLTAESDFTPFLKPGVPQALKNRALRKLWRVNPVFGRLDGLNDYDGDFTDAASVVKDLKTLYKVGRGFLPDPQEEPAEPAPGATPVAQAPEANETEPREDGPDPGETDAGGEDGNKVT